MAIGNLGSALTQLQGYIASEFGATTNNQGLSLLPEMVRTIASRADLTESYLRVTAPRLFDGTNDVDVESGAAKLIAVVAQTNASAAEDEAVLLYQTNTVTEGTTRYLAMVNCPAGGTSATAALTVAVYPEPIAFSALSWSVVDNGSDTDIESTTLGDANGTKVMLVYAEN